MTKKSSLGTGLKELLSDVKVQSDDQGSRSALRTLAIDLLKPSRYQPRQEIGKDTLVELADSIRSQGVIQPVIVRPTGKGHYEIVAGERRWRAAQQAGLHEVPVVVKEIPDKSVMAISLIENIQREDLNVIDMALGIQRLIDEFRMTHDTAAKAIGKSRTSVTNLLRLLGLSKEIKEMVRQNLLEMGHARALLSLDKAKQLAAAKTIIAKRLSVRASENLIRKMQKPKVISNTFIDPNAASLQRELSSKLAAPVSIRHSKKGKGKIIIKYNSLDELEGILRHIR